MSTTDASLEAAADRLRSMSRSERVERLFGFEPFPYQRELLDYGEARDIVEAAPKKGRQVGATLTASAIAADYALTNANQDVLVAAPFQETADELFRETKELLKNAEQHAALGVVSDNKREWEFDNGSRILSGTLGVDGVGQRGKSPSCVIVDEAAFVPDKIFDEVIEPFFLTHDSYEFYMFSTPAGKSGYYYQKVEHDDSWYSPHWPSRINPLVDEEWLEEKRAEKDAITFDQEYRGEFREDEDAYLSHDIVKPAVDPDALEDVDPTARRVLGVDVARAGSDRSVFFDLDEHGNTRRLESEETSTIDGVVGRIKALHNDVGYDLIVVDENAVGGGVVDFAQAGLGRVVREFTFTTKSKQNLYQSLRKDLEDGELTLPNHRRLIAELTSLQYSYTQHGYLKVSHPDGGHDDFPDALALANWARRQVAGLPQRDESAAPRSGLL